MFARDLRHTGYTHSSGPKSPRLGWVFSDPTRKDGVYASSIIVNGTLYASFMPEGPGNVTSMFRAIEPRTGRLLWESPVPGYTYSAPAYADGRFFIGSRANPGFFALDASNGSVLWTYATNGVDCRPSVWSGMVFCGGMWNGTVFALDQVTGAVQWTFPTGDRIMHTSPAIHNGTLYITSEDSNIYALNATTGAFRWKYSLGDLVWTPPTVAGDRVFVAGHGGTIGLHALSADTGNVLWTNLDVRGVVAAPAVAYGIVYTHTGSGLSAVSASSGSRIFQIDVPGGFPYISTPAVADGVVYFCHENQVHAVDAFTGKKVWSYDTGQWMYGSAVVWDGMLFVSGGDLFAFESVPPPRLRIDAWAVPPEIGLNSSSRIVVQVDNGTAPVQNASLSFQLMGQQDGSISPRSNSTDAGGRATSTYRSDGVASSTVAWILVKVSAPGYESRNVSVPVRVLAPEPQGIRVDARFVPDAVVSEGSATLWMRLYSDAGAVPGATVALGLSGSGRLGSVSDHGNGTYTAPYAAPPVTAGTKETATVTASKPNFLAGSGSASITVQPKPPVPMVISTSPRDGSTGVDVTTGIQVTFSLPMKPDETSRAFGMAPAPQGGKVTVTNNVLTWTSSVSLSWNTTYTVTIHGNATSKDGVPMGSAYSLSFRTKAEPLPPPPPPPQPPPPEPPVQPPLPLYLPVSVGAFVAVALILVLLWLLHRSRKKRAEQASKVTVPPKAGRTVAEARRAAARSAAEARRK